MFRTVLFLNSYIIIDGGDNNDHDGGVASGDYVTRMSTMMLMMMLMMMMMIMTMKVGVTE